MTNGFVYILQNRFLLTETGEPLLKIGGTARSAYERAIELSRPTGVPGEFSIVFETETGNWEDLEALVHRELKRFRRSNEFFAVGLEHAIQCIEDLKDKLSYLQTVEVPYCDIANAKDAREGVCFVESDAGYLAYSDGHFVGDVFVTNRGADYHLHEDGADELIFVPILKMPGQSNDWSRKAIVRSAKRRAAWLAPIMQRFTMPIVRHDPRRKQYHIGLNGLPLAIVTEKSEQTGLIFKKEVRTFSLEEIPFEGLASLDDDFNGQAMIKHGSRFKDERFFFSEARGLERSIREYVLGNIFASASMSAIKWSCTVHVMEYEINIVNQAELTS